MPGKCSFQECWLQDNELKTWVKRTKISSEATCRICLKNIDISNMGRAALVSHAKSEKHRKLLTEDKKTVISVVNYFNKSQPAAVVNIEAGAPPDAPVVLDDAVATTSEKSKLDSFVDNGKLFLYFATVYGNFIACRLLLKPKKNNKLLCLSPLITCFFILLSKRDIFISK